MMLLALAAGLAGFSAGLLISDYLLVRKYRRIATEAIAMNKAAVALLKKAETKIDDYIRPQGRPN